MDAHLKGLLFGLFFDKQSEPLQPCVPDALFAKRNTYLIVLSPPANE